jgi:hypothetical protein
VLDDFPIGTLVRRNPDYSIWNINSFKPKNPTYFTEVGEVIGSDTERSINVRWPDGEWFRYTDPHHSFIVTEKPREWCLPDELFEI